MNHTRKTYEQKLSRALWEQPIETAVQELIYLCNGSRGHHTTETQIRYHLVNASAGKLIRRLDPDRFETGYADYQRWAANEPRQ